MANLWVIMTGLGVFVERRRAEEPGMVLMRTFVAGNTRVGGVTIASHIPVLRRGEDKPDLLVPEFEIDFLPNESGGRPTVASGNRFLAVGPGLTSPGVVRPNLLSGPMNQTTRVLLRGGSVEPVQVDVNFQLDNVSRNLSISLAGLFDLPNGSGAVRSAPGVVVANGLLFRRTIARNDIGFSVQIAGDEYPVSLVPKNEMAELRAGDGHDDYVVWIVNVGAPGTGSPDPGEAVLNDLGVPPLFRGFDRDFGLFYEWLGSPPGTQHVPITIRRPAGGGQTDPPGQCMFGRVGGP
jgi:hypothetical protein